MSKTDLEIKRIEDKMIHNPMTKERYKKLNDRLAELHAKQSILKFRKALHEH